MFSHAEPVPGITIHYRSHFERLFEEVRVVSTLTPPSPDQRGRMSHPYLHLPPSNLLNVTQTQPPGQRGHHGAVRRWLQYIGVEEREEAGS